MAAEAQNAGGLERIDSILPLALLELADEVDDPICAKFLRRLAYFVAEDLPLAEERAA